MRHGSIVTLRRPGSALPLVLGAVVLLVVAAAVAALMLRGGDTRPEQVLVLRFAESVPEYLALSGVENAGRPGPRQMQGKVIPIDLGTARVDPWAYEHLPTGLRAERPEDVGAVLLIDWSGKPSDLAHVRLIDTTSRTILMQATFDADHARHGEAASAASRERVLAKIVRWVEGLPRA